MRMKEKKRMSEESKEIEAEIGLLIKIRALLTVK